MSNKNFKFWCPVITDRDLLKTLETSQQTANLVWNLRKRFEDLHAEQYRVVCQQVLGVWPQEDEITDQNEKINQACEARNQKRIEQRNRETPDLDKTIKELCEGRSNLIIQRSKWQAARKEEVAKHDPEAFRAFFVNEQIEEEIDSTIYNLTSTSDCGWILSKPFNDIYNVIRQHVQLTLKPLRKEDVPRVLKYNKDGSPALNKQGEHATSKKKTSKIGTPRKTLTDETTDAGRNMLKDLRDLPSKFRELTTSGITPGVRADHNARIKASDRSRFDKKSSGKKSNIGTLRIVPAISKCNLPVPANGRKAPWSAYLSKQGFNGVRVFKKPSTEYYQDNLYFVSMPVMGVGTRNRVTVEVPVILHDCHMTLDSLVSSVYLKAFYRAGKVCWCLIVNADVANQSVGDSVLAFDFGYRTEPDGSLLTITSVDTSGNVRKVFLPADLICDFERATQVQSYRDTCFDNVRKYLKDALDGLETPWLDANIMLTRDPRRLWWSIYRWSSMDRTRYEDKVFQILENWMDNDKKKYAEQRSLVERAERRRTDIYRKVASDWQVYGTIIADTIKLKDIQDEKDTTIPAEVESRNKQLKGYACLSSFKALIGQRSDIGDGGSSMSGNRELIYYTCLNTSNTCSNCGLTDNDSLSRERFKCVNSGCGYEDDRDANACKNLLKRYRREHLGAAETPTGARNPLPTTTYVEAGPVESAKEAKKRVSKSRRSQKDNLPLTP